MSTERPTNPSAETIAAMTAEGWGDDDGDLTGWVIGCETAARVAERLVAAARTEERERCIAFIEKRADRLKIAGRYGSLVAALRSVAKEGEKP